MSTAVISDKNFIRIYAAAWIALYLVAYFFLKSYLPEEYLRDSIRIQLLALPGTDTTKWRGAYGIAVFIVRVFPPVAIAAWVAMLGSFTIWMIVTSVRTIGGMFIIIPILIPCIILNMMDFGKESFILPLTYLVLWAATKARSTLHAVAAICFLYFIYGLFFREYYLIILAAFLGCIIIYKASPPFRILYIFLSALVLFVLPSKVFIDLQGDRDMINYLANSILVVHTAIYNPLPPNSAAHFVVNYLYTMLRLFVPFVFRFSASDVILFINVLIYSRLTYAGLKNKWMGPAYCLPLLFVAHVLVLIIFEPDAGSFMRHGSSVILYLLPSLRLVEARRAEEMREEQKQKKALNLGAQP